MNISGIWMRDGEKLDISLKNKKYLAGGKTGDREFKLKDQHVLTSDNRLFIKNDNNVRYIDYSDISGIHLFVQRKLLIICAGIAIIVGTLFLQRLDGWIFGIPVGRMIWGYGNGEWYLIIGMLLMLLGFMWKTLSIKFKVDNLSDELVLSGDWSTVKSLARFVKERRSQSRHD